MEDAGTPRANWLTEWLLPKGRGAELSVKEGGGGQPEENRGKARGGRRMIFHRAGGGANDGR